MDSSIKLFQSSIFYTIPMEIGAPGLYPASPLGTSSLLLDRVAQVLDELEVAPKNKLEYYATTYIQYLLDLPKLIDGAQIPPGNYQVIDCSNFLEKIPSFIPDDQWEQRVKEGLDNFLSDSQKNFNLKAIHISLLKAMHFKIEQDHQGLFSKNSREEVTTYSKYLVENHYKKKPGLLYMEIVQSADPKRPYGDRTYYYWDLEDLKIKGIYADGEFDTKLSRRLFSEKKIIELDKIHAETALALQALALYASF